MKDLRKFFLIIFLCVLFSSLVYAQPTTWENRGIGAGGGLFSPSISPHNNNEAFILTDMSGIYHTSNYGLSWDLVNYNEATAHLPTGIRFTSDPDTVYTIIPGYPSLLMVSTDGGETFNTLPSTPTNDPYYFFADDETTTRLITSGYGGDVYFSSNGGSSWSSVYTKSGGDSNMHLAGVLWDGDNIYVALGNGLLVSTNGGANFSFEPFTSYGIPSGQYALSFTGAVQDGTTRLFVCLHSSVYPGWERTKVPDFRFSYRSVYRIDYGSETNWTQVAGDPVIGNVDVLFVGMAKNDTNTVYLGGGDVSTAFPAVLKSTDAGNNWSNALICASNQNVTTGWMGNGGDQDWWWGGVTCGFNVCLNNSDRVIFGDLGFVHGTSDGGTNWEQMYVLDADENPAGYTTPKRQSYHGIGIEQTSCWWIHWYHPDSLFAGFADFTAVRSTDGGESFSVNYYNMTDNSVYCIIEGPGGILYAATSSRHDIYSDAVCGDNDESTGTIAYSTDGGLNWSVLHDFNDPVLMLAIDPNDSTTMYATTHHTTNGGVYVSNNIDDGSGSTWTKLADPPRTEGHAYNIKVLDDGSLVCTYSVRHNGTNFTASSGVFYSTNGGTSWVDRSDANMYYWTWDITVDPFDANQNTWYVGVRDGWGGYGNGMGGLYKTTDRGQNWTRQISGTNVHTACVDPLDTDNLYATSQGDGLIFSSNRNAATPTFESLEEFPFYYTQRVHFNPYDQTEIWVTTHGGGMFVGTDGVLPDPPSAPSNLVATAVSCSQIDLEWDDNSSNEYEFKIERSPDGSTGWTEVGVVAANDDDFSNTSLTEQTTYYYRVYAANQGGSSSYSNIANATTLEYLAPPTVSVTAPSDGATYNEPANVTLTANASDSDGNVVLVEFYNGVTKLGEDSSAPYSLSLTNLTMGCYTITAVATDDDDVTGISESIDFYVIGTTPAGNLALNQPAAESSSMVSYRTCDYAVDGSMTTRWSSQYSDPQWMYVDLGTIYSIDNVILYWEAAYATAYQIQVSTDASSWTDVYSTTSGDGGTDNITFSDTYARYVRMYGTSRATSYGYSIWEFEVYGNSGGNTPPTVSITSPANNATYSEPANVTITANASDSDGSVTMVDFYQGTTKIGSDNTAPYSYSWTNVSAGSYALTAVAKDNDADSTISSVINITVNSSTPTGNLAKDQPAYDSSHEMGNRTAARAVDSSMTTRWSSNYSDPQWMYVDLGASYSINHVIIYWEAAYATAYQVQVSDNATSWTDVYSTTSGDGGTDDITFSSTSARYVRMYGTARATSYGYSIWEFEVYGTTGGNTPPTVSITSPANNATYSEPANVTITANASDSDGNVIVVDFYQGTTKLGADSTAPYSYSWTNVSAGSYALTAVAKDNDADSTISSPAINITVNDPPTVSITSPANNATYSEPANVTITANASDSDGNVIVVDFYQGTTKLGADSTAPYSYSWTNVSAGSYALTAIAKDNDADSTISSPVINITVGSGSPTSNLAKDQPAYDSSHEMTSRTASAAVDSNMSTRWSSNYSDPQWMYVDLGDSYSINHVIIYWESAYATAYQIQVSSNASTWTDVYSTSSGDGGMDDITFSSTSARYVRMYGTSRATSYGYSIYEFEVYGMSISKGIVSEDGSQKIIPKDFSLSQNYPNPFNPETQISYQVASQADVKLIIYNAKGQVVTNLVDGMQSAGFYHVIWNGRNRSGIMEPSGIYFYRLDVNHDKGHFTDIKKMLLVK